MNALLAVVALAAAPQDTDRWRSEVILSVEQKLGGCAVGELDPRMRGAEVAAVAADGTVHVVGRTQEGWLARTVARLPGEAIQCAIGDADPTRPGNELLVFGTREGGEDAAGPGIAYLLRPPGADDRAGGEWPLEPVLLDKALIHAGCIADVDPFHPGNEIVLAGFSRKVHVLHRAGAGWRGQVAAELPAPAKNATAWRGGVALALNDGQLAHLVWKPDGWSLDLVHRSPAGLARLGVAGDELVAARDDGAFVRIEGATAHELRREGDKLRGAVLAELDPGAPGLEAATAGYEGAITVLLQGPDGPRVERVHQETERFHHLVAGELVAASPGLELVGCGYGGRLVLVGLAPAGSRD